MYRAVALAAILAGLSRPAARAAAPDLDPPVSYTVKAGETLYTLSKQFLISSKAYRDLQAANHVGRARRLQPGTVLRVPGALLRSEPIVASVVAFSGPVTVDLGRGPIPASLALKVGQGAVIATGANAFTTLELPDETRITVPSQSRLRIARLRRILLTHGVDRVFAVEQGRSESTVTPLDNPQSRYLITTPVASSAVRGTVFRVGFDGAANRATTEVVQGVVGVAGTGAAGGETATPAGFGVKIAADGAPIQVKLLAAPKIANAGKVQDEPALSFAMTPLAGAKAYHLQLANDAGFVDLFRESTSETGTVTFDNVADGTYFVRATAIDENGLEGLASVYSFNRELNALSGGPPAASGDAKMRRYLFRWSTAGDGVKTFRFQLYDTPAGKAALVDQAGLSEPLITVTDLKAGDYYWRVTVSTFAKGRLVDKTGELQQLHIGP
jgi:hypothetical protein